MGGEVLWAGIEPHLQLCAVGDQQHQADSQLNGRKLLDPPDQTLLVYQRSFCLGNSWNWARILLGRKSRLDR